ncbi:MAG: citrate (Si)-synthase [Dehalococcoidia bacterium]|nr:citrate (Si)-synthase [Dehalococcoidia bacterium]
MTTTGGVELKRGLNGVYLDNTLISYIDGNIGKLLYRGYDIHDLAEKSTFEEVLYLLMYGSLPTKDQLQKHEAFMRENRAVPPQIFQVVELTKEAHPMDVLRTAVSALSAFDKEVDDFSPDATRRKGLRLTGQAATILAGLFRIRKGLKPVPPSKTLNHAGNFLYMMFDKNPDPDEMKLMDVDFILHTDHSTNASAFAARVTASTLADLHCAVVSGIATLKGPLHGGAAEAVMKMSMDIGKPERAEEYVKELISRGGRIMGFGHRVYRAEDPRAQHLRERARVLGERRGQPEWFQILQAVVKAMEPYQKRGIFVNVDFYAGAVYHLLNIPEDLFIPIFALGRIPGYAVQVLEQFEHNQLIRPLLNYIGPMDLQYVPMDQRR